MSTTDIAQQALREPLQTDWNAYGNQSKYQRPPVPTKEGKAVVYYGVAEKVEEKVNQYEVDSEGNPFLNFELDPIKMTDGYIIRFARASTRPFMRNGEPIAGNPNQLAKYLKAAGVSAKPQTNDEYRRAVAATKGKRVGFTIDWEARNRDTGETVRGYDSFPDDPDNPGQKKAILKAGDVVTVRDRFGNITETRTITSEVLFANAKVRNFVAATPTAAK